MAVADRLANLFQAYYMDDEMIAVADGVMSPVCAVRENRPPEYGAEEARLEQEVILTIAYAITQEDRP